jgi:repressor LexA
MGRTPPGQTRGRVFRLVRDRLLAGSPPTVREVQRALGFRSVETAREHLETLVSEGRLAKSPGRSRGYRLPASSGPPPVLVPLLGRVPAGSLDAAVEDREGYVPVQSRRGRGELFALRVRGESMTGAGILPGDVVIVRRQRAASSGEVHGRRVELHPENPAYEPIVPDPRELTLLGKVIEVRRRLD